MRFLPAVVVPLVVLFASSAMAQSLVVDAGNPNVTIAADTTVSTLTVGSGGTLVVNATLTVTGDATI
jgi:hypothetical protein